MFFSLLSTNISIFSALEQFELITLYFPELGSISKIISFFFPTEILNNLNLNIFLTKS